MMQRFSHILFDLDGTLTDPAPGITRSAAHALRHFGIEVRELSDLNFLIGPPLMRSFEEHYGMSPEQSRIALAKYREYFGVRGLYENELYDGIPELLAALRRAGRRVILATSKPEEYATEILRHFGILQYFDFIGGNTLNEDRPTKSDVIRHIFASVEGMDAGCAIMVGDRKYDVEGAAAFGMDCIGVLYGYGSREELSGAAHIAATVGELQKILLYEP